MGEVVLFSLLLPRSFSVGATAKGGGIVLYLILTKGSDVTELF